MSDQSRMDGNEPEGPAATADAVVPPAPAEEPAAVSGALPPAPPAGAVPPVPPVVPGAESAVPASAPAPSSAPPVPDAAQIPGPTAQVPASDTVPPLPGSIPPAPPRQGSTWLKPFTQPVLLGALSHVGIAVGAAVVGAILLVFLVLSSASDLPSTPLGSIDDVRVDFGVLAGLLFALAAVVYGGEINGTMDAGGGLFSIGGSASIWVFPLTLTLAALVAVFWWGVRQGRTHRLPTWQHRAAYSAVVGLATGLVLLILTLVFAIRVDESSVHVLVTAAGYRVVLFSLVLVGIATHLGRWAGSVAQPGENWFRSGIRLFRALPRVAREALAYAAFGGALFAVLGAVFGVIGSWQTLGVGSIALGLLGLLNMAPLAAVLGHLGGLTATVPGVESTFTVFKTDDPLLWIAVLAAVLLSIFVALWIGIRRPRRNGIDWASTWRLPLVVLLGWFVVGSVFFGLGVSAGARGAAFSVGIGIALWSPFVMAVWAFAVEVGAQTLPALAYGSAPQLLGALTGHSAVAAWAAGTSGTTVGADAADHSAGAVGAVPEPKPLSPAAKRGLLIGLSAVGGVAVLAIAAGIAVSVLNSSRTPEAVAQQYLDAIAAGHAEAANALVDPNVPTAQRAFLTDAVMKSASDRITDVSVEREGTGGGDSASLIVTYRLDGVKQTAQLNASKGDPEFVVLDTWKLDDSLVVPVDIQIDGQGKASVGGVELPFEFENGYGQATVPMYPGVYELSTEGSKYFALEQKALKVGSPDDSFQDLSFAPTDDLKEAVTKQVNDLVDTCLASAAADPDGCPFHAYTFDDDTKVTWTKQGEPTVEIDDRGTQVAVEGTVVGSYTEDFFGTTREQSDEDDYSMYGDIVIDGDTVKVAFDDSWW
ncbi:hypothetical protein [uncultured Microbacterium sp.]|uniref:hypothetical protein n=1 Tax=uncultured Microbacterium sp. TaxID=191216 RepID=UPI0026397303|nr:hypothetical protein [uncultured Microbacterium sp.]